MKRSATILISAASGLVLLAAGTAGAAIAGPIDGSGVIHACYNPPNSAGSSRVVLQDTTTNCPRGTTAITWNQTGPQGPKGDTGTPGTGATVAPLGSGDPNCASGGASVTDGNGNTAYACNGAQGPPGTSQAYTYERGGFNDECISSSDPSCGPEFAAADSANLASMGSLSLPAGTYLAEATVSFHDGAAFFAADNSRLVRCQLSPAPDLVQQFVNGDEITSHSYASLTITVALSSNQPFTASLDCGALSGGTDESYVWADNVRINALAVDNINSQ